MYHFLTHLTFFYHENVFFRNISACSCRAVKRHKCPLQTSIKRTTIHWNEDIIITDANKAILQNTDITTTKKITISSVNGVELSNTTILCDEILISSADIVLDNVSIECSKITFANTAQSLTIIKLAKINSARLDFIAPAAGLPVNFSIKNTGPGELSITGALHRNTRNLIFSQLDNFKVNIQEN